jgi:hypothetical protein
VPLRGTQQI